MISRNNIWHVVVSELGAGWPLASPFLVMSVSIQCGQCDCAHMAKLLFLTQFSPSAVRTADHRMLWEQGFFQGEAREKAGSMGWMVAEGMPW